jgi:hypothetical protein
MTSIQTSNSPSNTHHEYSDWSTKLNSNRTRTPPVQNYVKSQISTQSHYAISLRSHSLSKVQNSNTHSQWYVSDCWSDEDVLKWILCYVKCFKSFFYIFNYVLYFKPYKARTQSFNGYSYLECRLWYNVFPYHVHAWDNTAVPIVNWEYKHWSPDEIAATVSVNCNSLKGNCIMNRERN